MQRVQVGWLLMAVFGGLTACGEREAPPSVAQLLHDPQRLSSVIASCKGNAGLSGSALCMAASEAGYRRGLLPCFKGGTVDHDCLDAHGYRR